jgi:hypothetical protein
MAMLSGTIDELSLQAVDANLARLRKSVPDAEVMLADHSPSVHGAFSSCRRAAAVRPGRGSATASRHPRGRAGAAEKTAVLPAISTGAALATCFIIGSWSRG